MADFQRHRGINGKVFAPVLQIGPLRKFNCPDCYSCQACSDERCRICRSAVSDTVGERSKQEGHPRKARKKTGVRNG